MPATEKSSAHLRDQAYGYICRQFIEGRLQPGSRLSVGSLAKEMGFSRTPVAEALQRLRMENVVEQVPRIGTIVRRPDVREITELYELRVELEGYAVAKLAERGASRELALLDRILGYMRAVCVELRDSGESTLSREGWRRYLMADLAFHTTILRGAENRWMIKAIEDARAFLLIFCSRRHEQHTLKTIADIYRWHGRIRNAIRRHDPEAAREAMRRHIRFSCNGAVAFLASHLGEDNFDPNLDLDISTLVPRGFDLLNNRPASEPKRGSGRGRQR